jgi:hypothetical protein
VKRGVSQKRQVAANVRFAKRFLTSSPTPTQVAQLGELTRLFQFSLVSGDLIFLERGWYVTHTGLVRLANRRHCAGIQILPIPEFSDALNRRYAFKAIVYKSKHSTGFVGYGDADPSNVSDIVRGAEMRVAETRAVNRAPAQGIWYRRLLDRRNRFRHPNPHQLKNRTSFLICLLTRTATAGRSVIGCAKLFVSINLIQTS